MALADSWLAGILLLWPASVWVCHDVAKLKGRNVQRWAFVAVFLGVVAAAVLLALPERCERPRACPHCLSVIPGAATRCRRCGGEVAAAV